MRSLAIPGLLWANVRARAPPQPRRSGRGFMGPGRSGRGGHHRNRTGRVGLPFSSQAAGSRASRRDGVRTCGRGWQGGEGGRGGHASGTPGWPGRVGGGTRRRCTRGRDGLTHLGIGCWSWLTSQEQGQSVWEEEEGGKAGLAPARGRSDQIKKKARRPWRAGSSRNPSALFPRPSGPPHALSHLPAAHHRRPRLDSRQPQGGLSATTEPGRQLQRIPCVLGPRRWPSEWQGAPVRGACWAAGVRARSFQGVQVGASSWQVTTKRSGHTSSAAGPSAEEGRTCGRCPRTSVRRVYAGGEVGPPRTAKTGGSVHSR